MNLLLVISLTTALVVHLSISQDTNIHSSQNTNEINRQVFDLIIGLQNRIDMMEENERGLQNRMDMMEENERELQQKIGTQEDQIQELKQKVDFQETVNRQQNATIQQLQGDEHVAFTAFASSDMTLNFSNKVSFNRTISNLGGHYDPQTSTFTCPVTGIYVFSVSIWTPHGEEATLGILKNTQNLIAIARADARADDHGDDDFTEQNSQASSLGISKCNDGESVFVEPLSLGKTLGHLGYPYTSFSGFLLYKL